TKHQLCLSVKGNRTPSSHSRMADSLDCYYCRCWRNTHCCTQFYAVNGRKRIMYKKSRKPSKDACFFDDSAARSEERRVGRECRWRWKACPEEDRGQGA